MTTPNSVLQPHHVVLFIGYRRRPQAPPPEDVVDTWRAAVSRTLPTGLVHRELCVQVPAWIQQAAAEIDHELPFDLIDYSIWEPDAHPLGLGGLPGRDEVVAAGYDPVEGYYTVAFRFVRPPASTPGCVMFNLFEVDGPAAVEQGFLMAWPPRGEFKTREPGFASAVLHQRMTAATAFAAFNRSEWQDADAYAAGIPGFAAAFPREARTAPGGPGGAAVAGPPPVRSYLGLFRVAAALTPPPVTVPEMTAVRLDDYGPPQVLRAQVAPRPAPGVGQVLVRVRAVSINPLDVKMRSGDVREIYPPWFPDILGYSVSGVIEAVGPGVDPGRIGQEVYGINNPIRRGGYAEFVTGPDRFFHPKPRTLDWAEAAAAPANLATAYGALFGRAGLRSGQRVLIHGGSGAIGSYAVELAASAGAYVIATASGPNLATLRELGADVAVDYRTERFEDVAHDVDLVLDTVGGQTRDRSWQVLTPGGTLATLLPPEPDQAQARRYRVNAYMVHGHPDVGEILPELTRRLDAGELHRPDVAARFPLRDADQAHALYESGPPRGRIVLEA